MDNELSAGVKWGAVGLIVGSLLLLPTMLWARSGDSALWFVALLVLMTTALTLTSMVFRGLKLADAAEAFGLPPGSVRTLLAVGVMVLLAVFGLKFFAVGAESAREPQLSETVLHEIEVPVDRLADEIKRYEKVPGLAVITLSPGRAASANGTNDKGEPAKLALHKVVGPLTASAADAQKQLLTSILTLLTTVIGFYFGSKGVSDGLRRDGAAGQPETPDPKAAADAMQAELKSLVDEHGKQRGVLDGLINQGPPAAAAAVATAAELAAQQNFKDAISKAQAAMAAADSAQATAQQALNDLRAKTTAQASVTTDDERTSRSAALHTALANARNALDGFKSASVDFQKAVGTPPLAP